MDGDECQVAVKYGRNSSEGGTIITVDGRHFEGTMTTKRDNDDGKPTQLRDD